MIAAVVIAIQAIANEPEENIRDFNRIRTHGLRVSATNLYQLSCDDPYIGSRLVC